MRSLGRKHGLRGLQPELLTVPLTFRVWDQTYLTTLSVPLLHVVKKIQKVLSGADGTVTPCCV